MLATSPVIAVVAVRNLEAAKQFYGGTLELREHPDVEEPGGLLYACAGGTRLLVYESGHAGTNEATAVSWEVEDLEGAMDALRAKGVAFERYDLPGVEREGDVHTFGRVRSAWFEDPDGNILNLVNRS